MQSDQPALIIECLNGYRLKEKKPNNLGEFKTPVGKNGIKFKLLTGADEIKIEMLNGEILEAKVLGTDPKTDVALLKVESKTKLPFVEFVALVRLLGQGHLSDLENVKEAGYQSEDHTGDGKDLELNNWICHLNEQKECEAEHRDVGCRGEPIAIV